MAAERCPFASNSATVQSSYKQLIRESILGYVFWTLFHGLAPMIWFYPLNELEISGYESFAVVLFSPIILGFSTVRNLFDSRPSIFILRLLELIGLASFQASSTLQRLILLAIGCFATMLVLALSLWHRSYHSRILTVWGLLLGYLAVLVSRIWFTSFSPAWWNNTTNSVIITIAALAMIDKIFSEANQNDTAKKDDKDTKSSSEKAMPPSHGNVKETPKWPLVAVAFGSQLFAMQWIIGEVSVIARWTVKGYPNTGPMPYEWGIVVLVCVSLGIFLCTFRRLVLSSLWILCGCISIVTLYFTETYTAAIGGAFCAIFLPSQFLIMFDQLTECPLACTLCLSLLVCLGGAFCAIFLPSQFLIMFDQLTECPLARTLCLSLLVWLIEILFSVWTVAFNFVPGGIYTREHSDWLIYFIIASFIAAFWLGYSKKQTGGPMFQLVTLSKCPFTPPKMLILLFMFVGLGGFAYRYPTQHFTHPTKVQPEADFTAAIWTYHFGYDNRGWQSLERGAWLLNETGADVITLLESDASKPYLGNNDLGMWLGEKLGMYVDFGVSTRDHTWGNLILSKYPIVRSTHHLLPSPHGELAPGITATVNMSGMLVDFVVTHMGNDRDVLDRELQAKFLAKELKNAVNPVVFLGYVTSEPFSRDYKCLTNEGNVKDIDSTDRERWCEYIMYRGLIRLGYARVSHGGLSDTEVQMARFRIPADSSDYKDHTRLTKKEADVSASTRFSSKFGSYADGHGWFPAHRFHMSTPKYFLP